MTRKKGEAKVVFSIAISQETAERLTALNGKTSLPKNGLIERALIKMLDRIDKEGPGCIWE